MHALSRANRRVRAPWGAASCPGPFRAQSVRGLGECAPLRASLPKLPLVAARTVCSSREAAPLTTSGSASSLPIPRAECCPLAAPPAPDDVTSAAPSRMLLLQDLRSPQAATAAGKLLELSVPSRPCNESHCRSALPCAAPALPAASAWSVAMALVVSWRAGRPCKTPRPPPPRLRS